jgi:hypothetical protein
MQGKIVYSYVAYVLKRGTYFITVKDIGDSKNVDHKLTEVGPGTSLVSGGKFMPAAPNAKSQANLSLQGDVAQLAASLAGPASRAPDVAGKDEPGHKRGMYKAPEQHATLPPRQESLKSDTGRFQDKAWANQNMLDVRPGRSLSGMLAGGDPIRLFTEPHAGLRDPSHSPIQVGKLTLMAPASGDQACAINDHSQVAHFDIVYVRPDLPLRAADASVIRPDDAAMIVRVFMLAKLAVARAEIRQVLVELASKRRRIDRLCRNCKDHAKSKRRRRAAEAALRGLWFELKSEDPGRPKRATRGTDRMVALESTLANWTASLHRRTADHKGAVFLTSLLLFAATICWLWAPYWNDDAPGATVSGWWLAALVAAGALFFLMNALNLRSVEQKLEENVHEHAVEMLNGILGTLVQTNANVAAANLGQHDQHGPEQFVPPEVLLRQMDEALHLKERRASIEDAIRTRQAHVGELASQIEHQRDRVRRSITAAGSGVFVGFFTHEVGESVMKYMHLTHREDPNAMLFWLFANGSASPHPAATSSARPAHAAEAQHKQLQAAPALPAPPSGHAQAVPPAHAPALPARPAGHEQAVPQAHAPSLDPTFVAAFHKPELFAHTVLLTVTITVSILTAWITMRKPASEQGAGHASGHH